MKPEIVVPISREVLGFFLWLSVIEMITPSRGLLSNTLFVDAMRFALGTPAHELSTGVRYCGVELLSIALFAVDHAPENMRPAMRQWIARHEEELDRNQSPHDKNWRTYVTGFQLWYATGKTDF